jgi:hypothetical protein
MKDGIEVQESFYTIVSNDVIKDSSLSMQAIGLYAYMVSNSKDWKFYKSELPNHFKNGRDAVYSAWNELVEKGWIISKPSNAEDGKLNGWNHVVVRDKHRLTGKPSDGKPVIRKTRHTENPSLINNNSNKYQLKEITTKSKAPAAVDVVLPGYIDNELWDEYLLTRKRLKAPNSKRALTTLLNKIAKMEAERSGSGIQALEDANSNGWKSVYPPKDNIRSLDTSRSRSEARSQRNSDVLDQAFEDLQKDGLIPSEGYTKGVTIDV